MFERSMGRTANMTVRLKSGVWIELKVMLGRQEEAVTRLDLGFPELEEQKRREADEQRLAKEREALLIAQTEAAKRDFVLALGGGVVIPGLEGQLPNTFASVAWSVGVEGYYEVFDDLLVGGSLAVGGLNALVDEAGIPEAPGEIDLFFEEKTVILEMAAKYRLYSRADLIPGVAIGAGCLFGVLHDQQPVREGTWLAYGAKEDEVEASPSLSASLSVDYRAFDFLLLGLAATYRLAFVGHVRHWVGVNATVGVLLRL